jgi:hypothetical protein
MKAGKHPLDFDTLDKGSVIPVEQIEKLTKTKRDEAAFSMELMALQKRVHDELSERGRKVVVCQDHGSLRILTDADAVDYTARLFSQRRGQLFRAHSYAMSIEVANLDDGQKACHERNVLVQGAQLSAMREAKRTALRAVKRQTPGIEHAG